MAAVSNESDTFTLEDTDKSYDTGQKEEYLLELSSRLGLNNSSSSLMDEMLNQHVAPQFVYRQPPLLVLKLLMTGQHQVLEMEREEVLREAKLAVPSINNNIVSKNNKYDDVPTMMGSSRDKVIDINYEEEKHRSYNLKYQGTLQVRDMRLFDPGASNSHDPEIIVRRHSVLVNLEPVKALVLHHKMFVFVPDGADSLLGNIIQKLQSLKTNYGDEVAFESRAIEALFMGICQLIREEYENVLPEVKSTINQVLTTTSGVVLERLRNLDSAVGRLEQRVSQYRHALYELLQSDRDMALMNLSRVHTYPHEYLDQFEESWSHDHEETELMIENYLQIVDGILTDVRDLIDELESSRSVTTLRLSAAQNKLLSIDLLVSTVTAVGTYGALVAAVFGMNLLSGVEEKQYWFWGVFCTIIIGVPIVISILFLRIKTTIINY